MKAAFHSSFILLPSLPLLALPCYHGGMVKKDTRAKRNLLVLDPDIWGFGVALIIGTGAMALGFWRNLDGFVIAVRVGLSVVITYAAVFLLVHYIAKAMAALAAEESAWRLAAERLAAERASAAESETVAEPGDGES